MNQLVIKLVFEKFKRQVSRSPKNVGKKELNFIDRELRVENRERVVLCLIHGGEGNG